MADRQGALASLRGLTQDQLAQLAADPRIVAINDPNVKQAIQDMQLCALAAFAGRAPDPKLIQDALNNLATAPDNVIDALNQEIALLPLANPPPPQLPPPQLQAARDPGVFPRLQADQGVADPPVFVQLAARARADAQDASIRPTLRKAQLLTSFGATEVEGYAEHFRGDGEQSIKRVFDVPWSSRKQWCDEMVGYSRLIVDPQSAPGAPDYLLTRSLPVQDPEPGYEHLYCSDVRLVGTRGSDGSGGVFARQAFNVYDNTLAEQPQLATAPALTAYKIAYFDRLSGYGLARYEATFTPRNYEVREDVEVQTGQAQKALLPNSRGELERYVTREDRYAVQTIPLPKGQLKFTALAGGVLPQFSPAGIAGVDQQLVGENAAYLLRHQAELVYTWHDVPFFDRLAVLGMVGKVNSTAFDGAVGFPFYPAYTLLMQAPVTERYRSTRGALMWRIKFSFLYRPETHLTLPGTASGAGGSSNFFTVAMPDGTPLYPKADFNTLFPQSWTNPFSFIVAAAAAAAAAALPPLLPQGPF